MGYDIAQGSSRITILPARQDGARRAVQCLFAPNHTSERAGGVFGGGGADAPAGRGWFAFMNHTMEQARTARDLPTLIDAWRWIPEVAWDGTITALTFRGTRMDQSHLLMAALGPFVEAGSFIRMRGEDGAVFQWTFDGTMCHREVLCAGDPCCAPAWLSDASAATLPDGVPAWTADDEAAEAAFTALFASDADDDG